MDDTERSGGDSQQFTVLRNRKLFHRGLILIPLRSQAAQVICTPTMSATVVR